MVPGLLARLHGADGVPGSAALQREREQHVPNHLCRFSVLRNILRYLTCTSGCFGQKPALCYFYGAIEPGAQEGLGASLHEDKGRKQRVPDRSQTREYLWSRLSSRTPAHMLPLFLSDWYSTLLLFVGTWAVLWQCWHWGCGREASLVPQGTHSRATIVSDSFWCASGFYEPFWSLAAPR